MTVVERVRELGLLRAAGATRGQLTRVHPRPGARSIGVVGSAIGIVLGGAARGGDGRVARHVGSVPLDGAGRAARSMPSTALAIGVVVTLAAAIEPARRAGRISAGRGAQGAPRPADRAARPAALARRRVRARRRRSACSSGRATPATPALLRALAVYARAARGRPARSRSLCRPSPALAGLPFRVLSGSRSGSPARRVLRDRSRAALTVGALTIGLAMIVALGGVGQHARAAAGAWIADVVPGDLLVTSIFPRRRATRARRGRSATLPGVASVSPIATFDLAIDGVRDRRRGDGRRATSPRTAACAFVGRRPGRGARRARRRRRGHRAGRARRTRRARRSARRSTVAAADGSLLDLRVVGHRRAHPARPHRRVAARRLARRATASASPAPTRSPCASRRRRRPPTARRSPTRRARSRSSPSPLDRIQGAIGEALDRVFGLFDVLALVAVIVAALGIVNTLTMNVLERVREIGVLRAAGMTRRQVWRSVVVEAGITGLVGAICGVVAGVARRRPDGRAGRAAGWDLATAVPWPAVGVAFVLGVALAMLAAAYPARLASGVSIVRAVGYE